MPTYEDLNDIADPTDDEDILAAWGDQVRDNFEAMRNPPRCYVNNAFENISDGTVWTVTFTTELYDFGGIHAPASPTLVIPRSGYWDLRAFTEWASNPDGRRFTQWVRNGVQSLGDTDVAASAGTKTDYQTILPPLFFDAGDEMTVIVNQSSGVTVQALVAASALWVCP